METKLRVELLSHTESPLELIYSSAKQCYSQDDAADIFLKSKYLPDEQMEELVLKVLSSGHTSVCECVSFSFAVSGISRSLSHQLVRHRIASYSQQSQRYVKADDFEYVVPKSVLDAPEHSNAAWAYQCAMTSAKGAYAMLLKAGIPAEDARYVLPNACETKIVVTMNCRALLNFFELRCCVRAQWEIRAMANSMLKICKESLPVVFNGRGARCEKLKYCPETKGCGRYPKLGGM